MGAPKANLLGENTVAKVNVNSASRDELVEAGVRSEIVEEILKLRRKEPITSADALDQIQGVGPATLDQLRKVLAFSEPRGEGDDKSGGGERGHEAERATKEAAQQAQGAAQAGAGAMRSGLQVVQRAAEATGEAQRETAQRSAEGTAELGQAWMELVQQQGRQNVQTLTALTRAVRWDEVLQAQGEFLRASVERMAQFTQRWLETSRSVMGSATAAAARDRRDRAA
jgi:hypothetical protein